MWSVTRKVRYKPRRDIPKAALELRTLSPTEIKNWVREHRTERGRGGKRQQVNITPESITMWLKRHPEVHEDLKAQIKEEEIPREAITEALFQNGTFEEVPCVAKWIMKLRARGAKERSIKTFVGAIKQICMGVLPRKKGKGEQEFIEGWGIKHPRRLTVEDGLKYNSEMTKRELKGRGHRLAMRNFFKSRNLEGWDDITGKLEAQAGQYAHLYIAKEKVYAIFEYLKKLNRHAYLAAKFGYKTGARITATLTAHAKYFNREEKTIRIFEKATRGKPKRIQEKLIPADLWEELPKEGRLFDIEAQELNGLLRAAFKEVIPELHEEIPMPFHFIARHQFAQHLLRATGWNYGLVARLGHWTVETLERYYGKMDRETAFNTGNKFLPTL